MSFIIIDILMEPKVETPKLYISQILNLQVLEEDQIEKYKLCLIQIRWKS